LTAYSRQPTIPVAQPHCFLWPNSTDCPILGKMQKLRCE
jgi:hypothetical protein